MIHVRRHHVCPSEMHDIEWFSGFGNAETDILGGTEIKMGGQLTGQKSRIERGGYGPLSSHDSQSNIGGSGGNFSDSIR